MVGWQRLDLAPIDDPFHWSLGLVEQRIEAAK